MNSFLTMFNKDISLIGYVANVILSGHGNILDLIKQLELD